MGLERPAEIFEVARILAGLRDELDLSQEDFAAIVGMSQSQYSKVEKATYGLRPKNIDHLAKKHPKEAERIRKLMALARGYVSESEPKAGLRSKTPAEGFYPLVPLR